MPAYNCWEYYVLDVDPDDDNLEKEMNNVGKDGWEVCGTFPEDGVILLKRPSDGITTYTGAGTRRKRPSRKEESHAK